MKKQPQEMTLADFRARQIELGEQVAAINAERAALALLISELELKESLRSLIEGMSDAQVVALKAALAEGGTL